MINPQKALKIILSTAFSPGLEKISIKFACGRILAENIKSCADYPEFDRSVMDGYAVRACNIFGSGVKLPCTGLITAGMVYKKKLRIGECIAIATGAMLPEGADSVVKKEDTEIASCGRIMILKKVVSGENVSRRGQDFKRGVILLKKGTRLNMAGVAVLASQGVSAVKVFKFPQVALLSTGDEVVEPGKKKYKGKLWNSSGPMISSALNGLGLPFKYLGIVKDREKDLVKKIQKGLKCDILLMTGAVSVGERDLVPSVLKKCGVKIKFHKISLRPGKPLLFGVKGRCIVFGLPGNPVSSMVSFLFFVLPFIKKIVGLSSDIVYERGILDQAVRNESDRLSFLPAKLSCLDNSFIISPINYSGSADVWSLSKADVFYILKKNQVLPCKGSVSFVRL